MRKLLLLVLVFLLAPVLVWGQALTTGRVSGTVSDTEGKPVAGAEVTFNSPAMQGERTFTTDSNGKYLAALLPPGDYTVTVVAPNMQPQGYDVRVGIGQTIPLDVTLQRGGVVEEVKVFGDLSKLETTAGGESFNYDTQISNLPVPNRELETVAQLAPNISFGPTPGTLSISGAPSFDTIVLLDGAEVSDPYFGSAPVVYVEEAIEELQVLTSGIEARYGRFQGGVINATTKSGTNNLDGSVRVDLSKESWNSQTPLKESQSDELNKIYSATVSGPIVKDRLTYFVTGRTIPTAEVTGQTVWPEDPINLPQDYPTTTDEDRWQVKLTGSINPNHVLEGSHLDFKRTLADRAGLPAADLLALGDREDPRETDTLEYQGVLSDKLFVNVQGTRKRVSILSGGDPAKGHPFLEQYGSGASDFRVWHNHWWDFEDPTLRDNDTLSGSLTQVLTTGNWGDHTLEYGIQYVNSMTGGENKQSSTGFNLLNYDAIVSGQAFSNEIPTDPRFNLLSYASGGLTYRWEALALGGGQDLKNTALYAQDTWEKDRWRLDVGLRWEAYKGKGPQPTLDLDFNELSPRLGVTYNLDNNWQLQATWGRYISRFNDRVGADISGVGGAPYIVAIYTGADLSDLTYDQVVAIIDDDSNWDQIITAITDPQQPTRFLAPDAHAPYADDLNLSVKRALPRNTGTFTLTYTDRRYRDLLDNFIGDQGVSTVVDPGGSGATFDFDTTIWDNSSQARRDYEALTVTWDYRPSVRWNVGGNWTYAETRANYEGEGRNTPSSGSIIGDYVRSVNQAFAIPYGYADDHIRHRIRAWGGYRFDFGRAGNLTLGTIGTLQSGLAFSRSASVLMAPDPDYLNEAGRRYTHFFDGRGNDRFNGFWRLDLSGRYQINIWKDLGTYVKLDVFNVTDNDELVAHSISGSAATDPVTGLLFFQPAGSFGQPRNKDDYQLPRSFLIAAGVQW